ncbi:MAG: hypothetical protein JW751_09685 [Polyangiaceae bacterium]|nr:hypothetical protein [Polyangiaceae bacterium]
MKCAKWSFPEGRPGSNIELVVAGPIPATRGPMIHSFTVCRLTSLCVVFTSASVAFAAEGDPCLADADCGVGYACELPPVGSRGAGVGGSWGAEPQPAGGAAEDPGPAAGAEGGAAATVEVVGECQRAPLPCTSDADCGEHQVCQFDYAEAACASGSDCSDVPVESSSIGECWGEPMACGGDGDCPEASTCVDRLCTFELIECTEDAGCPGDYECIFEVAEQCAASSCMPGETCDSEPVCTTMTTEDGMCFPKPIPCASDGDCSGGWLCYDVPNADAPEVWAAVDLACLPAGIIGALEGYVEVGGDLAAAEDSSMEATEARTEGSSEPSTASGDEDASAAEPESTETDGGCAVTVAGRKARSAQWVLFAVGLVLGLLRVRRPT